MGWFVSNPSLLLMQVVRLQQSTTEDPMAGNTGVLLFIMKTVRIRCMFLDIRSGISMQFPVMWQSSVQAD